MDIDPPHARHGQDHSVSTPHAVSIRMSSRRCRFHARQRTRLIPHRPRQSTNARHHVPEFFSDIRFLPALLRGLRPLAIFVLLSDRNILGGRHALTTRMYDRLGWYTFHHRLLSPKSHEGSLSWAVSQASPLVSDSASSSVRQCGWCWSLISQVPILQPLLRIIPFFHSDSKHKLA
jgi:hypothetical protein